MSDYPEIEKLRNYLKEKKISFKRLESKDKFFFPVIFSINNQSWTIYLYDEYEDFDETKPLICFYLTLVALDEYWVSEDYLVWCNGYGLDPSETDYLEHFRDLASIYREIESILGKIDPCVSDYDYTLRTGLGEAIRNTN